MKTEYKSGTLQYYERCGDKIKTHSLAQSFGKTCSELAFFLKIEVLEVSQIEWYQNKQTLNLESRTVLEVSQIEWYQNRVLWHLPEPGVLEVSQIEWYQNGRYGCC